LSEGSKKINSDQKEVKNWYQKEVKHWIYFFDPEYVFCLTPPKASKEKYSKQK